MPFPKSIFADAYLPEYLHKIEQELMRKFFGKNWDEVKNIKISEI